MARTVAEDNLQSFRFRVFEVEGNINIFGNESPMAGFNNVTMPNMTIEVAEHRTGNETYTRKFLGVPSVEDMTMTRGLLLGNTSLYDWVKRYLNKQAFRTDFEIRVYNQENPGVNPDDKPAKTMVVRNAIPISIKSIGDLDATSSDVNMQEIGVACESID